MPREQKYILRITWLGYVKSDAELRDILPTDNACSAHQLFRSCLDDLQLLLATALNSSSTHLLVTMFKPTAPLSRKLARLALTTKQVNGGYYKGNRTGSMGTHNKYGGYKIDWNKVRKFVVPENLADFKVGLLNKLPALDSSADLDAAFPVRYQTNTTYLHSIW